MNQQTTNYREVVAILPPGSTPEFTAGAFYMLGCVNSQLTLTNGNAGQPAATRRTAKTTTRSRASSIKEPSANSTSGKILTAIKNKPGTTTRSRASSIKEPSANSTSGKILTAIKNKPGITSAELQIETGLNGQQIGTALGGVSGSLVTKKLVTGDAMTGWNLAQSTGATSIQAGQRQRGRPRVNRQAAQQATQAA